MHIYFYARGIKHQLDIFETLAQSQFFKWKRINLKTGEEEFIIVQGALRKSVLGAYEYIFPEEALPEVLAIFGFHDGINLLDKTRLFALRQLFGASSISKEIWEKAKTIPTTLTINGSERALSDVKVGGVSLHLIGIKKDVRRDFEEFGYNQEAL